jgi:hypothetical protein
MSLLKSRQSSSINLETFAELLEQSDIVESIDLGTSVIHKVRHPEGGTMVLINTSAGTSGVIFQ